MEDSEGLDEIIAIYKKLSENSANVNIDNAKIEANTSEVTENKKEEEDLNSIKNFSKNKKEKMSYFIAKTMKDYYQIKGNPLKINNIKDFKEETRIIFERNKIVIVKALINSQTSKYKVIEEQIRPDEKALIDKYLQYHSIADSVNFSDKKIEDVFDEIIKIIDKFIKNYEINDAYIRKEIVAYYIIKEFGYYELTPLLLDKGIEDINGVENTEVIVHDSKNLYDYVTNIYISKQEIDKILKRFSEYGNSTITAQRLSVAVTLPEGSRFVCIYPMENQGVKSFSIRKQVFSLISPMKSIEGNFVTIDEMAFLSWILTKPELGRVGYIGLPGSGKTSFLKTMALFIPQSAKVFSIETTPEIVLTQKSWVRNTYVYDSQAQVKLINASLQYRPSYLIVGEVKLEKELMDNLFSVMSSGFRTVFTFHADTTSSLISKMQSRSLEIPKDRISNIKYLVFIVEDASVGKRYVANIDEIYDYDAEKDAIEYQTIIRTKTVKKDKDFVSLCSVDYNTATKNSISKELYDTFIKETKLPLRGGSSDPDLLLLMILKSKNIENYAKIYGLGENEKTEYKEPQLRFAGQYKKIYEEMNSIRLFIINELEKDEKEKDNPDYNDVIRFLNDWDKYYPEVFQ